MKIENWVVFPELVKVPIKSGNFYDAYGLSLPNLKIVDAKLRGRFGPYMFEDKEMNFSEIRKKYIIMYLSVSPKIKSGEKLEYSLFKAALDMAAEESTGTWDPDLKTTEDMAMDADSKRNMSVLQAKVIGMNMKTGVVAVALPKEGFEYGNLPQLLSVVMGNYTGMTSAAYGVRLEDIDLPDDYADSFPGPAFGNEGIKKMLGDRITVGTIVKPKTGLSEADWAKCAKSSFMGGLDVVKDDENLTSQDYCTFDKRAKLVLEAIKEVEKITGRKLVYVSNISCGDMDEMYRRADLLKSLGGNCLMIDILATGISAVQTIRKKYPNMILHGHRAGHGAQTVFPEPIIDGQQLQLRHGISMKVWTIVSRLAGIDQLHIGAPKGKMEASSQTVLENLEACNRPLGKIKPVRAICSGGLKSTVMWDVAKIMNPFSDKPNLDIIFQAGGGTHAHELGTFGGAKSLAQARDAIQNGLTPFQAISKHFETFLAFRKWDNEVYIQWIKSLTKKSKIVVEPDTRPYYGAEKEQDNAPLPVDIKTAIAKYPPLKLDIEKENPQLLS